jgi:DNA-binding IclR family transcriptional regulator
MATAAPAGQRKGIQSLEVGMSVLECIERAGGALPLTKIAKSCGMTASKTHFYLVSLGRVGLVSQGSIGGHYRLGPAALRLGLSALAQQDAVELARAEMARLSELTGDTVFLSVWGHAGATVISRFDGINVAPLAVRVGAVVPLTSSATGRVFLSWLPKRHTAPVLKRELRAHPRGAMSEAKLRSVIAQVKRDGFAITPGAVAPDAIAIAAPVFDYSKRVQCVLTITERASHLDEADRVALARALRDGAALVSRNAGYTVKSDNLG